MVVFKCKICGGGLDVQDGQSVATCEYCGTQQTLPTNNDDVIVNLFNRANNLRMKCEFDKATEVYEQILNLDDTLAEAHWGIVLCKYGVEYVEDSRSGERLPTCHRTQMESILSDVDYQATMQYADSVAKAVYEEEAAKINELQKKILQIVKSEKPFDVFICYKETDDIGEKTRDSVIANEIYHELTASNLKVFFAAITLEDKLGQEYEPYIYAALTSAKVMLVIGTKQEYFNAVWVKNEWSRYLHMMKTDKNKKRTLIPCFRDMDAYDLPDEFSHLQALDMAKISFMPDLIRGVKKLVGTETVKEVVSGSGVSVAPLLKRAFMFLEDGEFQRADDLLEEVLNHDPENAKAYVGKFMISRQMKLESELAKMPEPVENDKYYSKAYKFADEEYRQILDGYKQAILDRKTEEKYQRAVAQMQGGAYTYALDIFEELEGYKDSKELADKCIKLDTERFYQSGKSEMVKENYQSAITIFQKLGEYLDAKELAEECVKLRDEQTYQSALKNMELGDYLVAKSILEKLGDYKEAKVLIEECSKQDVEKTYLSAKQKMESKNYPLARSSFLNLGDYKDSKKLADECKKLESENIFENAKREMEKGNYEEAIRQFNSSGLEAKELIKQCYQGIEDRKSEVVYQEAKQLVENGWYVCAISKFDSISEYKDSKKLHDKYKDKLWKEVHSSQRREFIASLFMLPIVLIICEIIAMIGTGIMAMVIFAVTQIEFTLWVPVNVAVATIFVSILITIFISKDSAMNLKFLVCNNCGKVTFMRPEKNNNSEKPTKYPVCSCGNGNSLYLHNFTELGQIVNLEDGS